MCVSMILGHVTFMGGVYVTDNTVKLVCHRRRIQGRRQVKKIGVDSGHTWRASGARADNKGLGAEHMRGPGTEPLGTVGRGSVGL